MDTPMTKITEQLDRELDGYTYRGYLIRYNASIGLAYISKDGFHIGSARTCRLAQNEVDALTVSINKCRTT